MFEGDDRIRHTGGSPAFLSPESFQSMSESFAMNGADGSKYTRSTWKGGRYLGSWYVIPQIQLMIGVTLYCMLTGKLPFNVENPIDLFEAVKTQEYVFHKSELIVDH
jgi:[calcium/calmodulin-dependent protein kinase] kinase